MNVTPAVFILIALIAWLTAGAMAVRSVSRIWLRHWAERRLSGSNAATLFLDRPQRLLLAAGTGVSVAAFLAGVLLGIGYTGHPLRLGAQVVVIAVLTLVFGQVLPRALSRRWAPQLVPVLLPALQAVDLLLAPLRAVGGLLARPFGAPRAPEPASDGRDGLEDLLREGELEGVGEHDEIAIITGVVEFGEKTVQDVMTPREEVFALDVATPPRELARRIAQSAYSRVPMFDGSLDDVVGMVHAFDVLKAGPDRTPLLRPVAFAAAGTRCSDLLFEMLRARQHLAVVRDDRQATIGIVTLEDLLEELVGDIRDEHDEPIPVRSGPARDVA